MLLAWGTSLLLLCVLHSRLAWGFDQVSSLQYNRITA
jgi:hypothetical protein